MGVDDGGEDGWRRLLSKIPVKLRHYLMSQRGQWAFSLFAMTSSTSLLLPKEGGEGGGGGGRVGAFRTVMLAPN